MHLTEKKADAGMLPREPHARGDVLRRMFLVAARTSWVPRTSGQLLDCRHRGWLRPRRLRAARDQRGSVGAPDGVAQAPARAAGVGGTVDASPSVVAASSDMPRGLSRQHPSVRDLHCDLDLRLVPPLRHHLGAVVPRQIRVARWMPGW